MRHTGRLEQQIQLVALQFERLTALQLGRHVHDTVTGANQSANHQPKGLEQPAHFAITTLGKRYLVPMIGTLATAIRQRGYFRHAILQLDALEQRTLLFR